MAWVLFEHLHWTQRFEHAAVTTTAPCISLLAAEQERHGDTCVYKDITLDTWTATRQYVLEDAHGTSVTMLRDEVVGYAYSGNSKPFTWKTAAIAVAMALCLVLALPP